MIYTSLSRAGNNLVGGGGGTGGHNLSLPIPRPPPSRTFVSLCLPTPALYCVSPVIMQITMFDSLF